MLMRVTPRLCLFLLALWFVPDPFTAGGEGQTVLHVPADPGLQVVSATLYSDRGDLVREIRLATLSEGHWRLSWDGNDREGRLVPAGTYFSLVRMVRDGMEEQAVVRVEVLRTTAATRKVP